MGEKGRAEMGIGAAPGMCPELMEEEISPDPFQVGFWSVFRMGGLKKQDLRRRLQEAMALALGRLRDCLHITVE